MFSLLVAHLAQFVFGAMNNKPFILINSQICYGKVRNLAMISVVFNAAVMRLVTAD